MSDVGYDIVKWQKWRFWSIRVKIGLHKCQSEVGTHSDFFGEVGTRWVSDSITSHMTFQKNKIPIKMKCFFEDLYEIGKKIIMLVDFSASCWEMKNSWFKKQIRNSVHDNYSNMPFSKKVKETSLIIMIFFSKKLKRMKKISEKYMKNNLNTL